MIHQIFKHMNADGSSVTVSDDRDRQQYMIQTDRPGMAAVMCRVPPEFWANVFNRIHLPDNFQDLPTETRDVSGSDSFSGEDKQV